jgi:hypothetical protein
MLKPYPLLHRFFKQLISVLMPSFVAAVRPNACFPGRGSASLGYDYFARIIQLLSIFLT